MNSYHSRPVFFLFLFLISFSGYSQQATVIKLKQLESILGQKNDTTYVINFWATWCKPCVNELPFFLKEESRRENEKVRFIFISLDFKRELETRLNKFIRENNIRSEVYLIDEPDYDKWIDKVDGSWQGNIPATLIYNYVKSKRAFFAKDFSADELTSILEQML